MGACDFQTFGTGKDLGEAFRRATDDARYKFGHGGYTGTIAEKGEVRSFGTLPARWTVRNFVEAVSTLYNKIEYHEALSASDRRLVGRLLRDVGDATRLATTAYGDKWGPAVAVEVVGAERSKIEKAYGISRRRGERLYVFFGMASS